MVAFLPRARLAAAALALLLVVAACGQPKYSYVKGGGEQLTYRVQVGNEKVPVGVKPAPSVFKLPRSWAQFDKQQFMTASGMLDGLGPGEINERIEKQAVVAFDGSPKGAVENVLSRTPAGPAGFQITLALSDEERDAVSLRDLRNLVFPIDPELSSLAGVADPDQAPKVEVLGRNDELVRPGGLHGSRLRFSIPAGGDFYIGDQTVLVDSKTRIVYVLVVGCASSCFAQHRPTIEEIVSSWTFKER